MSFEKSGTATLRTAVVGISPGDGGVSGSNGGAGFALDAN